MRTCLVQPGQALHQCIDVCFRQIVFLTKRDPPISAGESKVNAVKRSFTVLRKFGKQLVSALVSGEFSVMLGDRPLLDFFSRHHLNLAEGLAISIAGNNLQTLPATKCSGDRTIDNPLIEANLEQHVRDCTRAATGFESDRSPKQGPSELFGLGTHLDQDRTQYPD